MISPLLALVVPALLSTPSSGRFFVLGTFDTPAADSAAVRKIYSADAFSNPASFRGLSVEDGALTLSTTLSRDPGKEYSAQAGILVPLNNLWAPVDIRQATSISFRIKGSGAYNLNFSLGSDTYPNGKDGVVMVAPTKVTTTWEQKTIAMWPTPALAWLSWMEDEERFPGGTAASVIMDPTDSNYNDETRNVAMSVKYLQFAIDPTWRTDSTWSAPASGVTTLSVDDIVIGGLYAPSTPPSGGPVLLGSFDTPAPDSAAVRRLYGVTAFSNDATPRALSVGSDGALTLTTTLVPEASGEYSAVAGIRVPLNALGTPTDIRKATGISFRIQGSGYYNAELVVRSTISLPPESDASAPIKVTTSSTRKFFSMADFPCTWEGAGCEELPSNSPRMISDSSDAHYDDSAVNLLLTARYLEFAIVPMWKSATTWSAPPAGPTTLVIDDIQLRFAPTSIGSRVSHSPSFAARYQDGSLSLRGLEGYASLEIRTLAGARIATLAPSASVRIRLDRGAYLLVARGEGKPALSRTLAVAR